MKIFPEKNQNIISNLSKEQIITTFNNHLEPFHFGIFSYSRRKTESTLFLGEINDTNFIMYHYIKYGNSFNPKINGSIKPYGDTQSIIELKFSLPNEIKNFTKLLYTFFTLFFLIFFSSFIYNLLHNKFHIFFILPLIVLIFLLFLTNLGMNNEISNSIEDIKKILHEEEKRNLMGL